MKCLVIFCLSLYAVTVNGQVNRSKFMKDWCIVVTEESLFKEKCYNYTLPDYLIKANQDFQKDLLFGNTDVSVEYFKIACCIMEQYQVFTPEYLIDLEKAKEIILKVITDKAVGNALCKCFDNMMEEIPERERDITRVYKSGTFCVLCVCLKSYAIKAFVTDLQHTIC